MPVRLARRAARSAATRHPSMLLQHPSFSSSLQRNYKTYAPTTQRQPPRNPAGTQRPAHGTLVRGGGGEAAAPHCAKRSHARNSLRARPNPRIYTATRIPHTAATIAQRAQRADTQGCKDTRPRAQSAVFYTPHIYPRQPLHKRIQRPRKTHFREHLLHCVLLPSAIKRASPRTYPY